MYMPNIIRKMFPFSKQAPKFAPNPSISPVLIAVVGCTGTGISTFIDAITDSPIKRASPENVIKVETPTICAVLVKIEGVHSDQFPVVLVDTPGIDFAKGPDFKTTFNNLNKWKNENHGKKAVFTGIVFMHRQVNQLLPDGEPSIQYNGILGDLCGPNWKDKVILVHNHQEETDAGIASKTPEELLKAESGWAKGFWEFVPGVKKIQRFDFNNPRRSAWKILWSLMKGTPNDLENKLATMTPRTDRLRDIYRAFQEVSSGTPGRSIWTST